MSGMKYPIFPVCEVVCFHCGHYPLVGIKSGSPAGLGEYRASCIKCEMWTWFDVPRGEVAGGVK